MIGLLQAFVEQVGHMGVKGLAECVHPAAGKAVDLFGGVWRRWQLNRHRKQMRDEVEAMAKMLDSYRAAEGKFPDQFVLPRGEA